MVEKFSLQPEENATPQDEEESKEEEEEDCINIDDFDEMTAVDEVGGSDEEEDMEADEEALLGVNEEPSIDEVITQLFHHQIM